MTAPDEVALCVILWIEVGFLGTSPLFIAPADLNDSHSASKVGPRPHMVGITFCQLLSVTAKSQRGFRLRHCAIWSVTLGYLKKKKNLPKYLKCIIHKFIYIPKC